MLRRLIRESISTQGNLSEKTGDESKPLTTKEKIKKFQEDIDGILEFVQDANARDAATLITKLDLESYVQDSNERIEELAYPIVQFKKKLTGDYPYSELKPLIDAVVKNEFAGNALSQTTRGKDIKANNIKGLDFDYKDRNNIYIPPRSVDTLVNFNITFKKYPKESLLISVWPKISSIPDKKPELNVKLQTGQNIKDVDYLDIRTPYSLSYLMKNKDVIYASTLGTSRDSGQPISRNNQSALTNGEQLSYGGLAFLALKAWLEGAGGDENFRKWYDATLEKINLSDDAGKTIEEKTGDVVSTAAELDT